MAAAVFIKNEEPYMEFQTWISFFALRYGDLDHRANWSDYSRSANLVGWIEHWISRSPFLSILQRLQDLSVFRVNLGGNIHRIGRNNHSH